MLDIILSDLRQRFGHKVLLSPSDIAEIIDMSEGQQANKRSEGKFPIPHNKNDFGRVKISIYDLAQYLANIGSEQVKQEIATIPDKLTRTQKKSAKGLLEKNWWLFRCASIFAVINRSILDVELVVNAERKRPVTKI